MASSRVVFAYSRDGALPGSRWLKRVNSYTKTPVYAVWFVLIIGALLGLLMFASTLRSSSLSRSSCSLLATSSGQVSSLKPITYQAILTQRTGPWNLGRFSKPVGAVACAWVALIIPVLCFPAVKGKDLNELNMNYTCLIYGGVMFLALVWYAIDARKWFKGPKGKNTINQDIPQKLIDTSERRASHSWSNT